MLHPRVFETFGLVGRIAIPLAASLAMLPSSAGAQVQLAPLPADAPAVAEPAAEPMSEWERFVYDRTARMTVPVSINGTAAVPFIIDTGAERTVISRELADRLGLPMAPAIRLDTIAGPISANSYRIDHLANGGFSASDFDAPALDRNNMGIDGLIGIESLKDKMIIFDFVQRQMQVLRSTKVRQLPTDEDTIVVWAKIRSGRLILSGARVFGEHVDLIIDTGAQSSVGNMALRRLALAKGGLDESASASIIDVGGTNVPSENAILPTITIANFRLSNLPIAYVENHALEQLGLNDRPAMLLGMDALSLFDRVEIDFGRRKVNFVMPGSEDGQALRRSLSRDREPQI